MPCPCDAWPRCIESVGEVCDAGQHLARPRWPQDSLEHRTVSTERLTTWAGCVMSSLTFA